MNVEIDSTLFDWALPAALCDRIERYLESKLPDPQAAALLQDLESAEVERTTRALRERFVISEPFPSYDKDPH